MIFRQLFDCDSSTYTYLIGSRVGSSATGKAALIDPVREQLDAYLRILKELGLTLTHALDTHVHADHITALGELRESTGCVTVMGQQAQAACVSLPIEDGATIEVGGLTLRAWHTPGHTSDSYCYLLGDRVFTGDTLLIRGTGRTDFQNGDPIEQHASLQRLLALPDETLVYPAHDYKGWTVSTIAEERAHNPRLQAKTPEAYAEIMNGLNLADPKLMDIAVAANRACGMLE